MKYRVTFEVAVPESGVVPREHEVREWIRFELHDNGYLAGTNPLLHTEMVPVPGTVVVTPELRLRVEAVNAGRPSPFPVIVWRRGADGRELVGRFDSLAHARASIGEVVVWERADHGGTMIALETITGQAYLIDGWS